VQELILALRAILDANDDFRRQMPKHWEADPLQDACNEARRILEIASRKQPFLSRSDWAVIIIVGGCAMLTIWGALL
jgi:hypothetical protein